MSITIDDSSGLIGITDKKTGCGFSLIFRYNGALICHYPPIKQANDFEYQLVSLMRVTALVTDFFSGNYRRGIRRDYEVGKKRRSKTSDELTHQMGSMVSKHIIKDFKQEKKIQKMHLI